MLNTDTAESLRFFYKKDRTYKKLEELKKLKKVKLKKHLMQEICWC